MSANKAIGITNIVKIIPKLNGAKLISRSIKNINRDIRYFSHYIPIHKSAIQPLKEWELSPSCNTLKNLKLKASGANLNIKKVRLIMASFHPLSKDVLAMEFNSKLGKKKVTVPAVFDKNFMFTEEKEIDLFAGGQWWEVKLFGIPVSHTTTVKIKYKAGIHMRPMHALIDLADKFNASITLTNLRSNFTASADNIFKLLELEAKHRDLVKIVAQGSDAKKAIRAIINLLDNLHYKNEPVSY